MIAEIDEIVNAQIGKDEPGVAVAVVEEGELVRCKGYGLANLEWSIPVQPDTVFRLASLTKQFTAAAIMLLAQQGKLRIGDPITTYLPDYPMHGREITIAHLLTHTSGITPYNDVEGFFERYSRNPLSQETAVALFKDLPLQFEPGTRFKYNNSGYYLLGLIIEAVSGKSYEEFVREQLFLLLKMPGLQEALLIFMCKTCLPLGFCGTLRNPVKGISNDLRQGTKGQTGCQRFLMADSVMTTHIFPVREP